MRNHKCTAWGHDVPKKSQTSEVPGLGQTALDFKQLDRETIKETISN